jgi:RNA methyltransferase, TrmH family
MITSVHNPRVKHVVRLRDHRQRRKEKLILIDGVRELSRAIQAGVTLQEVFVCPELCLGDEVQWLLETIPGSGGLRLDVSVSVFVKLAFGQRSEGVVGVAAVPERRLEDLLPRATRMAPGTCAANDRPVHDQPPGLSPGPLLAVLEGVEKPGNLGAVLRSADGAGVSALVVADGRTDLYNPNVIRASLGTVFSMPVAAAAPDKVLAWLRGKSFQILAARVEGAVAYTEMDYRLPTAIVLGNEAQGLTARWTGDDIRAICLPMLGIADSLNVSAAAAILFYEALRQRSN